MRSGLVASLLLLAVCLSARHVTTHRCQVYLEMDDWVQNVFEPEWNVTEEQREMFPILGTTKHMDKMIILVLPNNTEDVAKCTAERLCRRNASTCYILRHCFDQKSTPTNHSEKCQTSQFAIVHTFHFMCLVARAASLHTKVLGCDHEHVCPRIWNKEDTKTQKTAMVVAMTTEGSSAVTPATTGATTTCATTTGATTTSATTTGAATTSATTLQQSLSPAQPRKALEISHTCSATDITTLKALLAASCGLAFLLPLMVYIVMSRQRKQQEDSGTVRTSDRSSTPIVLQMQRSPETFDVPRHEAEALMNNNWHFHCVMNSEDFSSARTDMPSGGAASAPQEKGV